MFFACKFRTSATFLVLGIFATLPIAPVLRSSQSETANQAKAAAPWTDAQVLHAGDLAGALGDAKGAGSPTIIYVGFRTLFEGGHVPGAAFHGTASKDEGLSELKKSIVELPRSANLIIYCGCCPFDKCPNIRPAYNALHEMGFTHVRVLVLPTSFAVDWVEKGYPMQKGL